MLIKMADPELPFFKALERFSRLALMANVHYDQMVPYQTAAITMEDPYERSKSSMGRVLSLPLADPQRCAFRYSVNSEAGADHIDVMCGPCCVMIHS